MSNTEDIKMGMKESFVDNVEIPEHYDYLSDDEIGELLRIELDGYGFEGQSHLIYVDCRGLPEEFFIAVLKPDIGTIEEESTHISTDAAEITSELMNKYK